jgi:hypothetical protein
LKHVVPSEGALSVVAGLAAVRQVFMFLRNDVRNLRSLPSCTNVMTVSAANSCMS